ncbi:MAG: alpha/beta hydrolase [Crocinitomicaceae bacterium]|nr:alpha/beta hydrolase [Crocinitomicaceae bacterium]
MIEYKPQLKRVLLFIIVALFLTSCALNGIFLQPTKLRSKKGNTSKMVVKSGDNRVTIAIDEAYNPTFTTESDTTNFDFNIKSVVFPSASGNLLNAWEITPKEPVKSIATIIHFHGNAGSLYHQFLAITPLVKEGFSVFMFDYSGFGFSEGKAKRKSVLLDGNSAVDYVLKNFNQTGKIVIYGQSLGGHLAGVIGPKRQNDIDGLVLEGAFSSHKDVAKAFAGGFGKAFTKEMYSAKDSIVNYKKPLLIIHSEEDEVIPFYMGKTLFDAANEPKEFLEVKECHICAPKYYTTEIADKIKKMIGL